MMATLLYPGPLNKALSNRISCDFCAQQFDTIAEKNVHIFDHFEQQICQRCDQNLLRIGDNFYILHATVTCISSIEIKQETELYEQSYNEPSLREEHQVNVEFNKYGQRLAGKLINKPEMNEVLSKEVDTTRLNSMASHNNSSSFTVSECENTNLNKEFSPQIIVDETSIKCELDEGNADPMLSPDDQVVAFELPMTNIPITKRSKSENTIKKHASKYNECNVMLTTKNRRTHIAVNTNFFECDICKKVFQTSGGIRQHMISHSVQDEYSCNKCGSNNLTKNSFRRHHQNPNFMCGECSLAFCKFSQLKDHYKQHAGANPYDGIDVASKLSIRQSRARSKVKKYHCPIQGCNEIVSTVSRHHHLASKHKLYQYSCDICRKVFTSLHQIRLHMNVHGADSKRYKCNLCGTSNLAQSTLQRHHSHPSVVCNWCNRRFCLRKHLKQHRISDGCGPVPSVGRSKANKNLKRYKCKVDGCDAMLSTNNRSYHMATKHHGARFQCDVCKKCFATKTMVGVHILRLHVPSAKQFKCKLCGTAYLTQSTLDWHIKLSHIKEHNFMCSECGKTFCRKNQLLIHITGHTGDKPFRCTFESCSKRFRTQTARTEHIRSHTGEKPYPCPVTECDRRFAYGIDLRRHKFSAHGIYTKKYNCTICAEVFSENVLLKKHMKKHGVQV